VIAIFAENRCQGRQKKAPSKPTMKLTQRVEIQKSPMPQAFWQKEKGR